MKLPVALLPAASVALAVTVVVPSGKVLPEAGTVLKLVTPTWSVAEAVYVTSAPLGPVASAVMLPGSWSAGGVVSRTVIVKLPAAVLPAASEAVTWTTVLPSGNVEPDAGEAIVGTTPSTASTAEVVKVTTAPLGLVASAVMGDGTVSTGGGATDTVKTPVAVLPAASEAVTWTSVLPGGNIEPEGGEALVATAPSTASKADVVKVTTAPMGLVAFTRMVDGSWSAGGVVSRTVIVKLPVPALPAASVATAVTVVVPSGKVLPEAGTALKLVTPTLSVAEAVYVTSAPLGPVASAVMFDGTMTTGGVVSNAPVVGTSLSSNRSTVSTARRKVVNLILLCLRRLVSARSPVNARSQFRKRTVGFLHVEE
jgi:hypothetical protein